MTAGDGFACELAKACVEDKATLEIADANTSAELIPVNLLEVETVIRERKAFLLRVQRRHDYLIKQ